LLIDVVHLAIKRNRLVALQRKRQLLRANRADRCDDRHGDYQGGDPPAIKLTNRELFARIQQCSLIERCHEHASINHINLAISCVIFAKTAIEQPAPLLLFRFRSIGTPGFPPKNEVSMAVILPREQRKQPEAL
jgi:hypothetical protein